MHTNKIDCGREQVVNRVMTEACVNELELEVMLKCDL